MYQSSPAALRCVPYKGDELWQGNLKESGGEGESSVSHGNGLQLGWDMASKGVGCIKVPSTALGGV